MNGCDWQYIMYIHTVRRAPYNAPLYSPKSKKSSQKTALPRFTKNFDFEKTRLIYENAIRNTLVKLPKSVFKCFCKHENTFEKVVDKFFFKW